MPTVRLEEATKFYREKRPRRVHIGVQDVSLEVEQGDFVFVVGSRGAGKSTLLELLSGNLRPDKGAAYLDNTQLTDVVRRQKSVAYHSIGWVPQESALIRTATVQDNFMGRRWWTSSHRRAKELPFIRKALALVGMPNCEDRYPLEFSISECRRLELAKAILHSPPVLILDEITERMDDDSIWDMVHLLQELNAHGTTIIMSTHSRQLVNIMHKRVVTLVDGKIAGDVRGGRFGDLVPQKPSQQNEFTKIGQRREVQ